MSQIHVLTLPWCSVRNPQPGWLEQDLRAAVRRAGEFQGGALLWRQDLQGRQRLRACTRSLLAPLDGVEPADLGRREDLTRGLPSGIQEIYEDPRTIGHAVTKPEDTMAELRKLFNL